MSLTVKVGEAKTRLSELLAKVEAGEEVVIARGHEPDRPPHTRPQGGGFCRARRRSESRSRRPRQDHLRGIARLARRRPPVLMALVVDASLAAAWFLPDEQNAAADRIMAGLKKIPAGRRRCSGSKPAICSSWPNGVDISLPGEAAATMAQLRGFPIVDEGTGNDRLVISLAERHGLWLRAGYFALAIAEKFPARDARQETRRRCAL